jgi:hypothetical protein
MKCSPFKSPPLPKRGIKTELSLRKYFFFDASPCRRGDSLAVIKHGKKVLIPFTSYRDEIT